jgi:hypothetical protein
MKIYFAETNGERNQMNIILRDLDQTRVHFEVAVQSVGEQAAVRHLFGLSRGTPSTFARLWE